ncbi:MAG TPA: PAS domain-containing protein [Azospirillaceae bacterium]|nr:PAS domain-containing protein [Azospirillaceae bacterium]
MAPSARAPLTHKERAFQPDEIIVSKTDLKGRITYANDVFLRLAGYEEKDLIGQPHNIVRHPDMPRCVYKMLWDTLGAGNEIFAYVVNRAANGDHYWVFAHVTPIFGPDGRITGYHSSRRVPNRAAVAKAQELYGALRAEEARHVDPREGMAASTEMLAGILRDKGVSYDEFVLSL